MTIITSAVRAVELWISVLPFMVIGILLASIAVEFRIFNRLFPVIAPVLHHAHFTPHSGIAFITAFGSPITAVAMMAEFYNEKKINQKEALLATVAIWFPQTIYEAFAYIAPTIIPVLGVLGIAYLALFVLNGMVVAVLMVIAGRMLLTRNDCEFVAESGSEKVVIRTALKRSVNSSLHLLKRIVVIALPVSIMAFVIIDLGVFSALPGYLGWMPLPPEALAVIPLELANPMAAYITLADLMDAGILDFKLALLTLLVGHLLVSLRYIITHRLPYYSGIFGPVMSVKVISVSAGLQLGLTVMMILALVLLL